MEAALAAAATATADRTGTMMIMGDADTALKATIPMGKTKSLGAREGRPSSLSISI